MTTLLVVDDDPVIRQGIADWFQDEHWKVVQASSGEEALEIVRPETDAVVLDWSMPPGMDGLLALGKMRERFDLDGVCIVMLTAFGDVDRAVEALRNGAYQYVQKPFKFEDLKQLLLAGIACQRAHALRRRILSTLDVQQILYEICSIVIETVAPDALFVALLGTDGTVRQLIQWGLSEHQPTPDGGVPPKRKKFVEEIVRTNRPLFRNDAEDLSSWDPIMRDARSLVAAPVPGPHGSVVGVMSLESGTAGMFDRNWVDVLRYLADLVGLGVFVADAARVGREMEVYRQLPQTAKEIGHWISTPAQSIALECELLSRKELSAPSIPEPLRSAALARAGIIRDKAELIHRACESLSDITADVAIEVQNTDISVLLRDTVEEFSGRLAEEGITTEVQSPGFRVAVLADRGLLRYCLNCLIDNAVESIRLRKVQEGPDYCARIEFRADTDRSRSRVNLSIHDTGTGIPPEVTDRLFQPLFTTKDGKGGRGMGLFSARRIIVRHGGCLDVLPGWKSGATFTISLPVISEEE